MINKIESDFMQSLSKVDLHQDNTTYDTYMRLFNKISKDVSFTLSGRRNCGKTKTTPQNISLEIVRSVLLAYLSTTILKTKETGITTLLSNADIPTDNNNDKLEVEYHPLIEDLFKTSDKSNIIRFVAFLSEEM